jgi:hypothetical protein
MTEVVAEIRMGQQEMEAIDQLRDLPGVREITVMRSVNGSVL